MSRDYPFEVREDPYTLQSRLSYDGYQQAVPYDTWYAAKNEKAMIDGLIRNFMEGYKRHELYKYQSISSMAMLSPSANVQLTMSKPHENIDKPKLKDSPNNKLLLLCNA